MKKNDFGKKNFTRALTKLDQFLSEPTTTEKEQAGIIQAFEFCFETAWKALQKRALHEKLSVASPRKAFEYALQAGLILPTEESQWAQMLEDRNLTTHTYEETLAKLIADRVPAYRNLMHSLLKKL